MEGLIFGILLYPEKRFRPSSSKSWHYPPKVRQSALWTVLGDEFFLVL